MRLAESALLIVDDDENNRYTLGRRLQREGFANCTAVTDGQQALELLRAKRFDLVLLDVMMPGLSGPQVLERMRADDRLRHIPVIMISALDEMDSVIRCIELGAEDYLPKPFNPTLLRARVGASLDKKRLRDEIVAVLDQVEGELQAARQIQLSMVPTEFLVPTPDRPVEVYATLEPARRVGGDLYDFFWGEDGKMYFVVADVSDKGAPAALFMARAKTMIRLVSTLYRPPGGRSLEPHLIIEKVNEGLSVENSQGMFVTVFLGIVDPSAATLSYCNAGHNLPYLLRAGQAVTVLESKRSKPLGIRASFSYQSETLRLTPGDALFVFTDGIPEALNTAGEMFSDERLAETLGPLAGASARDMVNRVMDRVRGFAQGALQADDIAAMALRLREMSGAETITIRNRVAEIARVAEGVDRLAAGYGLAADVVADLQVALDEVLANIIEHGCTDEAEHQIRVRLQVAGNSFEATVEDDGVPFNPLENSSPDTSKPLKARALGGLGLHFVRNLMSEVRYERAGDRNRLVLRKALST